MKDIYSNIIINLASIAKGNGSLFARLELLHEKAKCLVMSFAEEIATQGLETVEQLTVLSCTCLVSDIIGSKNIEYYYKEGDDTVEHYILVKDGYHVALFREASVDFIGLLAEHNIHSVAIFTENEHDGRIFNLEEYKLICSLTKYSDKKISELANISYKLLSFNIKY
jgi:hypothetical protein